MIRFYSLLFLSALITIIFVKESVAFDWFEHSNDKKDIVVIKPVGSPFAIHLSKEYKKLSLERTGKGSKVFARKAVQSAKGKHPLPETLSQWKIKSDDPTHETLKASHERLTRALKRGARVLSPALAARAQTTFDCWLVDHKQNTKDGQGSVCQNRHQNLIAELEQRLQDIPKPPRIDQEVKQTPQIATSSLSNKIAGDPIVFSVYFDLNQSSLNDFAYSTLDIVLEEIRFNPSAIIELTGYTDRSGSIAYNQKLAQKRTDTVQAYLISNGVGLDRIINDVKGENNNAIQTQDGVKKAENRRVEIILK